MGYRQKRFPSAAACSIFWHAVGFVIRPAMSDTIRDITDDADRKNTVMGRVIASVKSIVERRRFTANFGDCR
jgi:hypothetical protein